MRWVAPHATRNIARPCKGKRQDQRARSHGHQPRPVHSQHTSGIWRGLTMGPLMTMTPAREVFTLGHVVVVDGSKTCFCSRRSRRGPRGTPGVRDERHPGYSLCWRRRQRHLVLVPPDRQNLAAHQCKHWWVQVWANQSNQHLARPPLPPCPTTAAMVRAAGVGPQRRARCAAPSSLLEVVSQSSPQRAVPPAPWAA